MSNENGTRLARQVRRFIKANPEAKSLENVEESAKAIILEIGNPDYFGDKSEEFEPFPPEWKVKRSFESQYKKLQKEYTDLPDLKKNVGQDGEKLKEETERKKQEDREKKEKEDREKQDKQQMGQEINKRQLVDQLKSMDPEQLEGLLQDLEISSGRGSRETSADTASSWNRRGSSVDPTSSDSGHWRKVRETFGEDTEYWLNKLSATSKENDCDFVDIKFYLEYLLRQGADRSVSDLGGLALEFVSNCPASQAEFVKELRDKDPQLNRAYNTYHASSRISGEKKERRPWARNPQAYRDRALEIFPPEPDENWDQIIISIDPDTNKKSVKGRITASIKEYLDVCLNSLRDNDEERHILVKRTDYLKEAQRFEGCQRGRYLTLKPETRAILKGRKKSDIKILNYAVAEQPFMSSSIKVFFVGIDKKHQNVIRAWTKTEFCAYANFKPGIADVNEQRKACGQKELFRVPKLDVPWPHQDSNSDSESPFESDDEQVVAV